MNIHNVYNRPDHENIIVCWLTLPPLLESPFQLNRGLASMAHTRKHSKKKKYGKAYDEERIDSSLMLRQERGENIETVRKNRMYEVPCTVLSAWWHWLRQQRKCFVHSTYLCLPCFVSASSPFPFPVLLVSRRSFPYLRCKVLSSVDPSLVLYLTSQPCSPQTAGTNQDVRQDKKNGPSHDAVNMKWRKKKKKERTEMAMVSRRMPCYLSRGIRIG